MHTRRLLVTMAREGEPSDGLADRIAVELGRAGFDVELAPPSSAGPLERYDAIVLGSELVSGRWHPSARTLGVRIRDEAPGALVWLFSSHALPTHGAATLDPPVETEELVALTAAQGHRAFAASPVHRPAAVGGPVAATSPGMDVPGDDSSLAQWASAIAEELRSPTAAAAR